MHLTKRTIDAAQYEGQGTTRHILWDDSPRGLGLRVYPPRSDGKTTKAFVLAYRSPVTHKKRLFRLGQYGVLTLDQARIKARKELVRISEGNDPKDELSRKKLGETFGDLADLYLKRHARKHKKQRSADEDERIIDKDLRPAWRDLPLSDIRRKHVIDVIDAIAERPAPVMANRTRVLVSKMFNFAIGRDLVDYNPATGVPAAAKEKPRKRILSDDELCDVWEALDDLEPLIAGLFKLRIVTLQRPNSEVMQMRWPELDLETGWWTLPGDKTKNGEPHRIPLNALALTVLGDLKPLRHASGWVFPSTKKPSIAITSTHDQIVTLREAVGIKDFTAHDFRRTGATRLPALGVSRFVVERVLNHTDPSVTGRYDLFKYDPQKRQALDAWGRYVENVVAGKPGLDNVVPLARGA